MRRCVLYATLLVYINSKMLRTRKNSDEIELAEINEGDEIELGEINEVNGINSEEEEEVTSCKEEQHPLADKTNLKWGKVILSQPLVRKIIIGIFIFLLFLGCFLFVLLPLTIPKDENSFKCTGDATHLFSPSNGKFALCHRGSEKIRGRLGDGYLIARDLKLEQVGVDRYSYDDKELTLSYKEAPNNHEDGCLYVKWRGPSSRKVPLRDCYNISDAIWFAGHTPFTSSWPLSTSIPLSPFVPNDSYNSTDNFGSVLHPVWLSTRGAAIFVDRDVSLFVDINFTMQQLCLQSLPYPLLCSPDDAKQLTTLEYRVCGFVNIKDAAVHFLSGSNEISYPPRPPHLDMFKYPIWSTRVKYQNNINQTELVKYLDDILSQGFKISNFEIGDGYSTNYGMLDFNNTKFPNITSFTRSYQVTSKNVNVTVWVHPFVDYKAGDFAEGLDLSVFYPGGLSRTEALVRWWNGVAAVINFEDEHAKNWFRKRLQAFQKESKFQSFVFDAGEANYLPECLYDPSPKTSGSFTAQYAQFAASFGSRVVARVGHFTQDQSLMIRMVDKYSTWGSKNGLHSVIIHTLSMGMMGYPFVLADVIGGNGHTDDGTNGGTVGLELYVRWMQLVTFLPSMQFSIPPWDYENESNETFNITEHAKELVDLHARLVDEYISKLAKDVSQNGNPIIRPLWWIAPDDLQAINNNDQFLIGNDVMVAPIIEPGARERMVYFPEGTWIRCSPTPTSYSHQSQKHSIPVNLTTVLWFEKSTPSSCKCCTL